MRFHRVAHSVSGRGRYGNVKKPVYDNHRFDSQLELERYLVLKLMQKAGEISGLELQPKFPIEIGGVKVMMRSKRYHKNGRQLVYIADFRYTQLPRLGRPVDKKVIEDVKMQSGHKEPAYKIKRALMEAMGYRIVEV